jgi:hypothetical protein
MKLACSASFLAVGGPIITHETGFSKFLPTGKGLFGFLTMEDILAAVDVIESDYEGACRAAWEVAAEYFAAEKVLGSLMDRAGLQPALLTADRLRSRRCAYLGVFRPLPSVSPALRNA